MVKTAPQDIVLRKHRYLHHYTSVEGACGILSSNELWATSFSSLNDSSELFHLKLRLGDELAPYIDKTLKQLRKNSRSLDMAIAHHRGPRNLARMLAQDFANLPYECMINGNAPIDIGRWRVFIFSFCTHDTQANDEDRQGTLNQWRAYAGNGGVALAFDSKFVAKMLSEENKRFEVGAGLFEVEYDLGQQLRDVYPFLVGNAEIVLKCLLTGGSAAVSDEYFESQSVFIDAFVHAATTFKHAAFKDEREVRIMGIVHEAGKAWGPYHRQPKSIKQRGEKNRPYIALNEDGTTLIDGLHHIIIGPGSEQTNSERKIRDIIGETVPIYSSDIPFVFS